MKLAYLKIFPDFAGKLNEYKPDQRWNLFEAMLNYAFDDVEPMFTGEERLAWPFIRDMVDAMAAANEKDRRSETSRENGKTGGRPKKPTQPNETYQVTEKPNETYQNLNKPKKTYQNLTKPNETKTAVEKEKEKEQENNLEEKCKKEDAADQTQKLTHAQERFATFWAAYPKRQGKGAAETSFERIHVTDELLAKMLDALARQKTSPQWSEEGGRFIPYPATWLNQKRWEDDAPASYPSAGTEKRVTEQQYEQRENTESSGNDIPDWLRDRLRGESKS